ncbi:TrbI/VirB10 family protein [Croceicoccus mobilis]|uniref:Conjugative transfer factor, TraB n=1 Tax=Croceicoccus mobilis TaxID=1703339 RepID=A0A917DZ34_9SPHN|nr:TrbI/VirB10 family protein [Croceicoccus mobilis]GGD82198.1 conjugative transfer factor, TraB [Croceicoccus mobilis]
MDILKRKQKDLDTDVGDEHDFVDEDGGIAENTATQKKQRMLLMGGAGLIAILSVWYVMDGTEEAIEEATGSETEMTVSTDALMNRQVADQNWMSVYEHQMNDQDRRLQGVEQGAGRMAELEAEIQALRGENAAMVSDGTRVLDAYERENAQLKQQLERASTARPSAPGPAAAAAALGVPQAGTSGVVAAPISRSKEVKLVSFGAASGTAARIDPANGATTYTDSPNYLPPNSIAKATVVVGVDATTNTRSQSDPLPVLLRVTGPARSVFSDGKLLATRVQGCMVNGAAYGDLSSEKVYVKLQRMTCPQPGGRYAVSEVKGFLAYGGKVGIRGRVVSREGGLTTQAFLAGLLGGAGSAFENSTRLPTISDGDVELPSASTVGIMGLGGGAKEAGTTLSDYLIERAEQYQPVVEMPTGANVEVVFLDGTFIRN